MKQCIRCKNLKPNKEFTPRKVNGSIYKLDGSIRDTKICDSCMKLGKVQTYRTFLGRLKRIYLDQCSNSIKRGHKPPDYTEKEFISKFSICLEYTKLYQNWKK